MYLDVEPELFPSHESVLVTDRTGEAVRAVVDLLHVLDESRETLQYYLEQIQSTYLNLWQLRHYLKSKSINKSIL